MCVSIEVLELLIQYDFTKLHACFPTKTTNVTSVDSLSIEKAKPVLLVILPLSNRHNTVKNIACCWNHILSRVNLIDSYNFDCIQR